MSVAQISGDKFAFSRAINNLPLISTEKLALKIFAEIYNPALQNNIFPTIKTLAKGLSLSEAYTRKIINGLSRKGWLIIRDAKILVENAKPNTSNRYYLAETILLHEKKIKLEKDIQIAASLNPLDHELLEKLNRQRQDVAERFEFEKNLVMSMKPRVSQINGRKGFETKFPGVDKKQDEPRECLILSLDSRFRNKKSDGMLASSLQQKLAPGEPQSSPPPSMQARHNTKLNIKNNTNHNTTTSETVSNGEEIVENCVAEYCKKLGKRKLPKKQKAKFRSEFTSRNFTFEDFQRNLDLIVADELLKKTTFSILRVLEVRSAIESRKITIKNLRTELSNGGSLSQSTVMRLGEWFENEGEAKEWVSKNMGQQFEERSSVCSEPESDLLEVSPLKDFIVCESNRLMKLIYDHQDDLDIKPCSLPLEAKECLLNSEVPPINIQDVPETKESILEAIEKIRNKFMAPNFTPYSTSREVFEILNPQLFTATSLGDLLRLANHPVFEFFERESQKSLAA